MVSNSPVFELMPAGLINYSSSGFEGEGLLPDQYYSLR